MKLVVLGWGESYRVTNQRTGEVVSGRELWALSVDEVGSVGFVPFKIPTEHQHLFPRTASVYDVEYEVSVGRFGPQQRLANAVFLGPWSALEGVDPSVVSRAV